MNGEGGGCGGDFELPLSSRYLPPPPCLPVLCFIGDSVYDIETSRYWGLRDILTDKISFTFTFRSEFSFSAIGFLKKWKAMSAQHRYLWVLLNSRLATFLSWVASLQGDKPGALSTI